MAKKTEKTTGSTAKASATSKPKLPDVLITAKEVAKIISDKDNELPDFMEVNRVGKVITFNYKEPIPHEHNTLNKFTMELRQAFQVASLPKWKAIFIANGKRFVSTL